MSEESAEVMFKCGLAGWKVRNKEEMIRELRHVRRCCGVEQNVSIFKVLSFWSVLQVLL